MFSRAWRVSSPYVARAVGRRVGVAPFDEPLDERLHLLHARRGAGLVGGRQDAERVIRRGELELDPVGQRPPLLADALVGGGVQDLVVDVGDVADERDAIAPRGEPAAHEVVDECTPQVPDVRARLHRRAAHVHAHVTLGEGHEVTQRLGLRVVESHGHPASLPAGLLRDR
jgi:hypothetical protein